MFPILSPLREWSRFPAGGHSGGILVQCPCFMRHVAACLFAFLLLAAQASATFIFASGNLLALNEGGTNAITRAYDGLNRVTSYTEGGNTIGYRYYPSGKLAKLIYPGGTENGVGHVEYLYNSEGRLWQVIDRLDSTTSPRVTTYSWNADGRLASVARPNGTVRTITYDSAGRPSAIGESAGATSLLAFGISYYPSDEIKTLDVTPAAPIRKTKAIPAVGMTFDAANRSISPKKPPRLFSHWPKSCALGGRTTTS